MTEFEKDYYKNMVRDFKNCEHLFSKEIHDFINDCTNEVMTQNELSSINWFKLGIYYAKVNDYMLTGNE